MLFFLNEKLDTKNREIFIFWGGVFLGLFVFIIKISNTDLSPWDLPGHLAAIKYYQEYLWPRFQGWNPFLLGGYPQGYLYPSFVHWFAGGLAKLVGVLAATKLIIAVCTFMIPIGLYKFFRTLEHDRLMAAVGTMAALIFLFYHQAGGTFRGLSVGGLLTAFFGISFLFIYLVQLDKALRQGGDILAASALLGLIILSHAFTAMVALAFSGAIFLIHVFGNRTVQIVKKYIAHLVLGLLVGAMWWVPYIFHRESGGGFASYDHFIRDINLPDVYLFLIFCAVSVLCSFFWLMRSLETKPRKHIKLLILSLIFYFSLNFAFSSHLISEYWVVHVDRIRPFIYILGFSFLAISLTSLLRTRPKIKFIWISLLWWVCLVTPIIDKSLVPVELRSMRWSQVPQGRGLINNEVQPLFFVKYQTPLIFNYSDFDSYKVGVSSAPFLLNGLFQESSLLGQYTFSLINELGRVPYTWLDEKVNISKSSVYSAVKTLGIQWVLSPSHIMPLENTKSPPQEIQLEFNSEREHLVLKYFLYQTDFALVNWEQKEPRVLPSHTIWRSQVNDWWEKGDFSYSLMQKKSDLNLTDLPVELAVAVDKAIENTRHQPLVTLAYIDNESFDIAIHSDALTRRPANEWLTVKIPYFSNWTASQNGQSLEIYRASPDFMAVKPVRLADRAKYETIHFKFVPDYTVRFGYVMTALAVLIICILSALRFLNQVPLGMTSTE